MSDLIIVEENSAVAHAVIRDSAGVAIPGAVFDTDAEVTWLLDNEAFGTVTVIDNETCVYNAIQPGQTNLRLNGVYQGQALSDIALVTVTAATPETFLVSIEWDAPVPAV